MLPFCLDGARALEICFSPFTWHYSAQGLGRQALVPELVSGQGWRHQAGHTAAPTGWRVPLPEGQREGE